MKYSSVLLLCLIFIVALNVDVFAYILPKQGAAVKGKFLCGETPGPVNTTKVQLVDIDWGIDPDDELDVKYVDENGEYSSKGFTNEVTPIDPVLYVWTDCNDENKPGLRKIKFVLPKTYIIKDEPKSPKEWIDMGVINLQTMFDKEKQKSI